MSKNYLIIPGEERYLKIHKSLIKLCAKYGAICNLATSDINIAIENCSLKFEKYLRSNPPELKYLRKNCPHIPIGFYRYSDTLEMS